MDRITETIGALALLFTMMSISLSPHPVLLIASYLIHELGHLFFAKINSVKMGKIKLGPFKMKLFYDCSSISYKRELLVCAGGIVFNLLCVIVTLPLKSHFEAISFFCVCNLSLALMNFYPVSTLDGGRIMRCLFLIIFEEELATKICRVTSFLFAFFLWLFAVYLLLVLDSNASLFFISVFLLVELCFSA